MSPVAYPNLGLLATRTKELLAELQQFCGGHREAIEADTTLELRIQRFRDGLSFIGKLPPALLALLTVEPIETSVPLSNGAGDIHHKLDQILKLLSEEDPSTPQALELLTVIRDGVLSLGDPSSMGELIKLVQGQGEQLSALRNILADNDQRDRDLDLLVDELAEWLSSELNTELRDFRHWETNQARPTQYRFDNANRALKRFGRVKHTFKEARRGHLQGKADDLAELIKRADQGWPLQQPATVPAPAPNPERVLREIHAEEQNPDGLVSTLVTRAVRRHLERGSARSVDEEPEDERPVRNAHHRQAPPPGFDDGLEDDEPDVHEESDLAPTDRFEPVVVDDGNGEPILADSPNGAALKSLLAPEGD